MLGPHLRHAGVVSALGNALDLNNSVKVEDAGDILEMAGGGLATGLGLFALRQQGGETRRLASTPNMLAKLFDRPTCVLWSCNWSAVCSTC